MALYSHILVRIKIIIITSSSRITLCHLRPQQQHIPSISPTTNKSSTQSTPLCKSTPTHLSPAHNEAPPFLWVNIKIGLISASNTSLMMMMACHVCMYVGPSFLPHNPLSRIGRQWWLWVAIEWEEYIYMANEFHV